jgi:hypothetical protein
MSRIFALTVDTERKLRIASILVSRGGGEQYLAYLRRQALLALLTEREIPWPVKYDKDANETPNPEFVTWVASHNAEFWDTYRVLYYQVPSAW